MMSLEKVFDIIKSERAYQDQKWGGCGHDYLHTFDDWLSYMSQYLSMADKLHKEGNTVIARNQIRKLAALAVACMQHKCPTYRTKYHRALGDVPFHVEIENKTLDCAESTGGGRDESNNIQSMACGDVLDVLAQMKLTYPPHTTEQTRMEPGKPRRF